jgi:hypothetical protein
MYKSLFLVLMIAAFFVSCSNRSANTSTEKQQQTVLTVADFDSLAPQYVGKEVIISGLVDHVCRESGKRMFIMDGDSSNRVKITVGDNIPTFNVALEGSNVVIKGVVEELKIDEAYLVQWEDEIKKQESKTKEDSISSSGQGQHKGIGEKADQGTHESAYDVINQYRDQIAASGKGYIAFYSVVCEEFEEKE